MVLGISEKVFFSGMPSDAAGPVADTVTPTLMSAQALPPAPISAAPVMAMASRVFSMRFMLSPSECVFQERKVNEVLLLR